MYRTSDLLKKLLLVLSVFVVCVLISQAQAISNIIITPNSFTVPTNQQVASYNATTGTTSFRNITSSSSVSTDNVVYPYFTGIGNYSTPTNAYASSSQLNTPILDNIATSSDWVNNSNATHTVTITVNVHPNEILIAGWGNIYANTDINVNHGVLSSVKLGSLNFTKVVNKTIAVSGSEVYDSEIFYLSNPPTGTYHITFTPVTAIGNYGGANVYAIYNVNSNPIGIINTNSSSTRTIMQKITPTTAGSWIIDNAFIGATIIGPVNLSNPSFTQAWMDSFNSNNEAVASQYNKSPNVGSSNIFSWTSGSSNANYWVETAIELKGQSASFPTSNVFDNNLVTEWRSNSTTNPYIVVDTGSKNVISALAIYPDKTQSNETQISILTSADNSTFTVKRTINMSSLTNGTWNFVRWDLDGQLDRYVKIYGNSGSKVILSIPEIKTLTTNSTTLLLRHGHESINPYDGSLPLNQ